MQDFKRDLKSNCSLWACGRPGAAADRKPQFGGKAVLVFSLAPALLISLLQVAYCGF